MNDAMKSIRVTSEHTIGILKARFPFLKAIRNKITEETRSTKKILQLVECAIILHNLLMTRNEPEPEDWDSDDDDTSDIDDANRAPTELCDGDSRRHALMIYMNDHFVY